MVFFKRFLLGLVALTSLLLLSSAAYTAWRSSQIASEIRPEGQFASIDGAKLHYHFFPADHDVSETPVLVFLHGASGNANDTMLAFRDAFAGRYPLLFIDRPGLGFSERNFEGERSLTGQAGLIAGLVETLGIEQAIVVGHSFGAAVTAVLGLTAPERIAGLAFISPVSHPWPGGVDWHYNLAATPFAGAIFAHTIALPAAERLAPAAVLRAFAPGKPPKDYVDKINLPLLFRPASFRANAEDVAGLKKQVIEHSKNYASLSQPSLVVTGTEDTVVWPSIHSQGLHRDLPDTELVLLEGAGHMPHHTHTAEIVEALERLVRRVGAASEPASRVTAGQ